ncbi:MAG: M15 family metallopeptidase [Deltaproteobacteria bacterium]|nr:M15 family metallopeptidase [Deltaproteobacteria bacterium]
MSQHRFFSSLATLLFGLLLLGSSSSLAQTSKTDRSADRKDCGNNYMLKSDVARLGSHSFLLVGQDGPHHVIAAHRSGTPPHNYQYVLRLRLDDDEMAFYKNSLKNAQKMNKRPLSFTTIHYDDTGKKLSRTFFCMQDLPRMFGAEQEPGDDFEMLFPIKGSLLENANHEGKFEIQKSAIPGGHSSLARNDIELIVFRYLPGYLPQKKLRKAILERPDEVIPLLSHAPLLPDEPRETASTHRAYRFREAKYAHSSRTCRADYLLKNVPVQETIHRFFLVAASDDNHVLALHVYDESPQNFMTLLRLKVTPKEMKAYRRARGESNIPPVLQTRVGIKNHTFCMASLRKSVKNGRLKFKATLFDAEEKRFAPVFGFAADEVEVIMNRYLVSFMNPLEVARETLGTSSKDVPARGFVDVKRVNSSIQVEMRYAGPRNFIGRPINDFERPRCFVK